MTRFVSRSGHPLAGTIYVVPPVPTSCGTCHRGSTYMKRLETGLAECSHVACPHRNRITAQPSNPGRIQED